MREVADLAAPSLLGTDERRGGSDVAIPSFPGTDEGAPSVGDVDETTWQLGSRQCHLGTVLIVIFAKSTTKMSFFDNNAPNMKKKKECGGTWLSILKFFGKKGT